VWHPVTMISSTCFVTARYKSSKNLMLGPFKQGFSPLTPVTLYGMPIFALDRILGPGITRDTRKTRKKVNNLISY